VQFISIHGLKFDIERIECLKVAGPRIYKPTSRGHSHGDGDASATRRRDEATMMRRVATTAARARAQAVQAVAGTRARAFGTFQGAEQEELAYAPKKAVRARDASATRATTGRRCDG